MPACGRRKCLFLSPLLSFTRLFFNPVGTDGSLTSTVVAHETPFQAGRHHPPLSYPVISGITPVKMEPRGVEPRSHALQACAE